MSGEGAQNITIRWSFREEYAVTFTPRRLAAILPPEVDPEDFDAVWEWLERLRGVGPGPGPSGGGRGVRGAGLPGVWRAGEAAGEGVVSALDERREWRAGLDAAVAAVTAAMASGPDAAAPILRDGPDEFTGLALVGLVVGAVQQLARAVDRPTHEVWQQLALLLAPPLPGEAS